MKLAHHVPCPKCGSGSMTRCTFRFLGIVYSPKTVHAERLYASAAVSLGPRPYART